MLIDSRTLPNGHQVEADVCIIGGGVAGITLAHELINRNIAVCLLESGGWEPHPVTQTLGWGENLGHRYFDLDRARARCLGGSSARWDIGLGPGQLGARLRPLDPIDFERREEVPYSGWPFGKEHLQPFYQRADALCGVEPFGYEPEQWIGSAGGAPLLSNEEVQTVIFKFVARDLFKEEHPRRVAGAPNISVFQHATALEVETDRDAHAVTGIRAGSLAGNRFRCHAKLYVIANGGIEAPRLLLLSNRMQNGGLGNQNDLVGRFFMEHYHFRTALLVPEANAQAVNPLYLGIRHLDGVPLIGKLALSERTLRSEKLLNSCVQLLPERMAAADLAQVLDRTSPKNSCRRIVRKVRKRIDRMRRAAPVTVFRAANMSEQVPNPDSRVSLSDKRDRFGQNCTRLDWRVKPEEIRSVHRTQEILSHYLQQAGLGQLHLLIDQERTPGDLHGGYHHMGTTRMHTDPRQGVVDEHARVHGIANLYIAGPSVFPTGGYANPTLTTVAMSIRLADRINAVMDRDDLGTGTIRHSGVRESVG